MAEFNSKSTHNQHGNCELKPCLCGSDDISTFEERYFFFSINAFIKCRKCHRTIERRTLKQATKAWNTRTPQKEVIK